MATSDASENWLEQLWIHDLADRGTGAFDRANVVTSLRVTDSLIEGNSEVGMWMIGGSAAVQQSMFRDSLADGTGNLLFGMGVLVTHCNSMFLDYTIPIRLSFEISGSFIERSHVAGLFFCRR